MPTTLVSNGVQFPDNSVQTTAGGAVNTTTVLNATAGLSAGAVGTYGFHYNATGSNFGVGATTAGSNLRWTNTAGNILSNPAGTWRCLGDGYNSAGTVWIRIS